jgi:hypothetical protein
MTAALLKLRARDDEDMRVVSAILQDSIAPVCDIFYDASGKNFFMVVLRLRREVKPEKCGERICCGLNIHGVEKAQVHGIDLALRGQMLGLLAVLRDGPALTFVFAGGAKIRLQMKDSNMIVEDFGEPWPSNCNPCHDLDPP